MASNTLISFENLQRVLEEYGTMVVEHYKQHLTENGHIATSKLINSIKLVPVNGLEVSLSLEEYWKRVEYDNRAHWAPPEAIYEWVKARHILPNNYNGDLPNGKALDRLYKQSAFVINRAMAGEAKHPERTKNPQGGTKGTHDLQKSIDEVNAMFEVKIIEALAQDIENMAYAILSALK